MKPSGVGPCLSQSAGAVDDLAEEIGKLVFQLVPLQAFLQSPNGGVLPELFLQMPGQSMILSPRSFNIPEQNPQTHNPAVTCFVMTRQCFGRFCSYHKPSE